MGGEKAGMEGRKIKKLLAVVCELHEPITETPGAKCSIELKFQHPLLTLLLQHE